MHEYLKECKTDIYCRDHFNDSQIKDSKQLRKFLYKTISNFSDEMFSFYEEWGEFPFTYSEKQINSILVPSIHEYTKNIWLEQPFKNNKKKQRFLDIATTINDDIYLIELKHSWNNVNEDIYSKTSHEWQTAITQIEDINKKSMKNHFECIDYNVFKIALLIMPTFIDSKVHNPIVNLTAEEYTDVISEEFDRYIAQKYHPNFISVIKLREPYNYENEYQNKKQIYPFISFIAKVIPV